MSIPPHIHGKKPQVKRSEAQLLPEIWDWRRPFGDVTAPLVPRYLRRGVTERRLVDGTVLIPLDERQARKQLEVLARCRVDGLAICLINSYVEATHEFRLRELAFEVLGDIACSVSFEVAPLAKEYVRASTTLIDVFMKLIYADYFKALSEGLKEEGFTGELNFVDCAASLVPYKAAMERPHRNVFSGPAAGTVSSAYFGEKIGEDHLICCDVGGTSCDISLVSGGKPTVTTIFELEHDLIVNTLTNEVSSIGAGGGSIIAIQPTGELTVGPDSAGADPGPACYGRGGILPTMTDACLLIGILDEQAPLGGTIRLQSARAKEAFEALESPLSLADRIGYAYQIGLNNISEGILDVCVRHGLDPRDFVLLAYGSAGPMILPGVLREVGARSVVIPPYPGLFSALGLISADLAFTESRSSYMVLSPETAGDLDGIFATMEAAALERTTFSRDDVTVIRTMDGHLMGQTWETPFVPIPSGRIGKKTMDTIVANFHQCYDEHWGGKFPGLPVVGVTYRVQVVVPTDKVDYPELPARNGATLEPVGATRLRYLASEEMSADVYDRGATRAGDVVTGPAIIRDSLSTVYVLKGQVGTVGRYGEITVEASTD